MTRNRVGGGLALLVMMCAVACGGDGSSQTAACEQWVSCVAEARPTELPVALATYGDDGTCWKGDSAQRQACDVACRQELDDVETSDGSVLPLICREPVDDNNGDGNGGGVPATSCVTNLDCSNGFGCHDGVCFNPTCTSSRDCPEPLVCAAGLCLPECVLTDDC